MRNNVILVRNIILKYSLGCQIVQYLDYVCVIVFLFQRKTCNTFCFIVPVFTDFTNDPCVSEFYVLFIYHKMRNFSSLIDFAY